MPTIDDLPIGAKLKFGAYSVDGEAPHKIRWIKAHRDNTVLSEYIEDLCAFDAKEPENPSPLRRSFGNNRYSLSNIHQFLNSEGTDWFQKKHAFDTAPDELMYTQRNGYSLKPGFLTLFEQWEIDAIEVSEIKIPLPRCDAQRGVLVETVYAKVFLPSTANVGARRIEDVPKGDETWELFSMGPQSCHYSVELRRSRRFRNRVVWARLDEITACYLLRSPSRDTSYRTYAVEGNEVGSKAACNPDSGIRPALRLNPDTSISDEPDSEGYYEVLALPQQAIEISEKDFLAILKTK